MDRDAPSPVAQPPGPGALFLAFLWVGLSGFGGVLPWARRMLVERRNWLTGAEFAETLALCQSLPGPNVVNLSIVVGSRFAGARGAASAFAGLTGAPVIIVVILGVLYGRFGGAPHLAAGIAGVAAAAAGLVAATALKMAVPLLRQRPVLAAPVIVAAFIAVGLAHLPLPWVLAVLAPSSVALAWCWRPRPAP